MCPITEIRQQDCNNTWSIEACGASITSSEDTSSMQMEDLSIDNEKHSKKSLLRSSFVDDEFQFEIRKRGYEDNLSSSDSRIVRKPLKSCMSARSMSNSLYSSSSITSKRMRGFTVGFKSVEIREYKRTLGDNPSVSRGPAITLGWEYDFCDPVCINRYEEDRGKRRIRHELLMPPFIRVRHLKESGYLLNEINEAVKDIEIAKIKRKETANNIRFQNIQYAAERTKRKMKKILSFGKTETKNKLMK